MFEHVSQSYTLQDASSEILILLIGAFLLGLLMGWLMWGYQEKGATTAKTDDVIELPPRTLSLETTNVIIQLPANEETSKKPPLPERHDDLKVVEGIGPKIEQLLYKQGITTWKKLSATSIYRLKDLLAEAGDGYVLHDPSSWPEQARLAHADMWQELMQMQTKLRGNTA